MKSKINYRLEEIIRQILLKWSNNQEREKTEPTWRMKVQWSFKEVIALGRIPGRGRRYGREHHGAPPPDVERAAAEEGDDVAGL